MPLDATHHSRLHRTVLWIGLGIVSIGFVVGLLALLPVNRPHFYGAIALMVIAARRGTALTWARGVIAAWNELKPDRLGVTYRIIALLLWLHLVVTGLPDVGNDALAMHVPFPTSSREAIASSATAPRDARTARLRRDAGLRATAHGAAGVVSSRPGGIVAVSGAHAPPG
jgi:hypothetical protein